MPGETLSEKANELIKNLRQFNFDYMECLDNEPVFKNSDYENELQEFKGDLKSYKGQVKTLLETNKTEKVLTPDQVYKLLLNEPVNKKMSEGVSSFKTRVNNRREFIIDLFQGKAFSSSKAKQVSGSWRSIWANWVSGSWRSIWAKNVKYYVDAIVVARMLEVAETKANNAIQIMSEIQRANFSDVGVRGLANEEIETAKKIADTAIEHAKKAAVIKNKGAVIKKAASIKRKAERIKRKAGTPLPTIPEEDSSVTWAPPIEKSDLQKLFKPPSPAAEPGKSGFLKGVRPSEAEAAAQAAAPAPTPPPAAPTPPPAAPAAAPVTFGKRKRVTWSDRTGNSRRGAPAASPTGGGSIIPGPSPISSYEDSPTGGDGRPESPAEAEAEAAAPIAGEGIGVLAAATAAEAAEAAAREAAAAAPIAGEGIGVLAAATAAEAAEAAAREAAAQAKTVRSTRHRSAGDSTLEAAQNKLEDAKNEGHLPQKIKHALSAIRKADRAAGEINGIGPQAVKESAEMIIGEVFETVRKNLGDINKSLDEIICARGLKLILDTVTKGESTKIKQEITQEALRIEAQALISKVNNILEKPQPEISLKDNSTSIVKESDSAGSRNSATTFLDATQAKAAAPGQQNRGTSMSLQQQAVAEFERHVRP